jgi:hypothetical protein
MFAFKNRALTMPAARIQATDQQLNYFFRLKSSTTLRIACV